MKLDRKSFRQILMLLASAILIAWLMANLGPLWQFVKRVIGILSPFILGLAIAFIINIVLRPLESFWTKLGPKKGGRLWNKLRRPVCLVLSLIVVFGIIFAIFFIVVPEFTSTLMSFVAKIPEYYDKIDQWWNELTEFMAQFAAYLPEINSDPSKLIEKLTGFIADGGRIFLDTTIGTTSSFVSALVDFFVALVFCIYILAQKERFGASCKRVLTALFSPERVNSIIGFLSMVNKTFSNFVTGQLTEAVIIGVLCFIGMLILRMPYAPVVSVLVGFTALIPVFGAFIGTGIGAFLILLESPIKAIGFVVFIIILQQLEGNIIYPRVVGKSVGLPAIFVLMAVTVGGSAFGMLGMLIGVPVSSVIYTVVNKAIEKRLAQKGIDRV